MIRNTCESMARGTYQTLGIVFNEGPGRRGWLLTKKSQIEPGKTTLQAALTVAHHSMMSQSCTTVRMWSGLPTIPHLIGFTYSDIYIWLPGKGTEDEDAPTLFSSEPGDTEKPIPCKSLASEMQDVRNNARTWQEVCFIQFLGASDDDADDITCTTPLTSTVGGGIP